jgi:hypothetical protein
MKIKEITIGKSFKISKNYNSLEANLSMTIEIDENDQYEQIIEDTYKLIEIKCKEQLKFKGE